MDQALLLVGLFCAIVASAVVARRFRIPAAIAFVVVGIAIAFIPGLHGLRLNPQLLFDLVLPPLLFAGGWTTDWQEFKRNLGAISTLAIGLVIFTTVVVAAIVHALAGFDWAMAFVLGAIVSPPDAVAPEAIFQRLALPRRIASIITGEGLFNDGVALVLYRFALGAAVAGTFSMADAPLAFVLNVVGGIACGLVVGILFEGVLRALTRFSDDATVANVVALLAPYAAYLPADAFGVSGVLSAVMAGVYLSRRSQVVFTAEGRVIADSVWQVMLLLLNGLVFLQIGLTLPFIYRSIQVGEYVWIAVIISIAVIVLRLIWVFTVAPLRRMIPGVARRDPLPTWQQLLVLGWSGMRGIISLAAALAIPYVDAHGAPLHGRAEIIFITLCVIVVTLLLHGLTLGPMIAWLGLGETDKRQGQEMAIRVRALQGGARYLRSVQNTLKTPGELEAAGRLLGEYERRIAHLQGHLDEEAAERELDDEREADRRLELGALDAERHAISSMRRSGEIPDDIYQDIEYDLDLAGLRLR
ncbi:MAG TPA: Na+/H+ antiporter [Candidatus Acidoferrales bacterium]|nr:Na+/H+ antiporter [Candidatus Acidoferrales bacterium]